VVGATGALGPRAQITSALPGDLDYE